ncbi:hypothetical protein C8R42DRAFT_14361 [Lentinula raphanica]|nr:hypothetical protein C8R42DRAFT_14361 [Lentinula raphanica]
MYSLLFLSWLVGTISAAVVDGSNVQLGQSAIAHWSLDSGDSALVEGGFGLGLYQTEYGLVATTTVPPIQAQLTTGAWTVTPMVTGSVWAGLSSVSRSCSFMALHRHCIAHFRTLMLVLRPNLQYPLCA